MRLAILSPSAPRMKIFRWYFCHQTRPHCFSQSTRISLVASRPHTLASSKRWFENHVTYSFRYYLDFSRNGGRSWNVLPADVGAQLYLFLYMACGMTWKINKLYKFFVCASSLNWPSFKEHVPYYIILCAVSFFSIFLSLSHKRHFFQKISYWT
jgi:hypothetical protein